MNDAVTDRLALPLLEPGQAQKEMTHNEALAAIDLLLAAGVEAAGLDQPPASPVPGMCWIVGAAPVGAWTGRARALAGWTIAGWRFAAAVEGMTVWDRGQAAPWRYHDGAWHMGLAIGAGRAAAIADPGGGGTIDAEARAAIGAILAALRTHGLVAK